MTLPAPSWTHATITAWRAAVPAELITPPGDPADWTCLLSELGGLVLSARDDAGNHRVCDVQLVRALTAGYGHPTRDEDPLALLLVTPLPRAHTLARAIRSAFGHSSYAVRMQAALTAGRLGMTALLPDLRGRLADSDNDVRRAACESLGRLGDLGVVPDLLAKLGDGDGSVDLAVIIALLRLGADDALATIADEERGSDEVQKLTQAWVAARAGELGPITALFEEQDDGVLRVLGHALVHHPEVAESLVEPIADAMEAASDEGVGQALAMALGSAGEEALDAIAARLDSGNWTTRMRAAIACTYAPDLGELAAPLTARLTDDDYDVRRESALACGRHGVSLSAARPMLWSCISENYGFAERLAHVGRLGIDLDEADAVVCGRIPPLAAISALGSYTASEWMRTLVLLSIGLGSDPHVGPSLRAIAEGLPSNATVELRRAAVGAMLLAGITPSFGVSARLLLHHDANAQPDQAGPVSQLAPHAGALAAIAARDPHWQVRLEALKVLDRLGDAAAPYAELIAAIGRYDDDADCRRVASHAGARRWASPQVGDLLPLVLGLHRYVDDATRAQALQRLVAEEPALARPLAQQAMHSDDRDLARAAARTLGSTLTAAQAPRFARDALGRLLADGWVAREVACDLLGSLPLSSLDDDLRDELRDALQERISEDSDSDVRNAATAALARLGGAA